VETLGTLVDNLSIVHLKLAHVADLDENKERLFNLGAQAGRLTSEINAFILAASNGLIQEEALLTPACKVYPKREEPPAPEGSLAHLIDYLAEINAALWATQEEVARIREIPPEKKDEVVERCFDLNMERSRTVDAINRAFAKVVSEAKP